MTHEDLVQIAARWLRRHRRCTVVLAPRTVAAICEQPDAIGWTGRGHSELVEVKTSRADLLRDRHKFSRRAAADGWGMGRRRWMLMPLELAGACGDVMAEHFQGWGLLGVEPQRRRVIVLAEGPRHRDADVREELCLVLYAVRAHQGDEHTWLPLEHRFVYHPRARGQT